MRTALVLRLNQKQYIIGGFVFEIKKPAVDWLEKARTQIGIFPPQKSKEGIELRFWGYTKVMERIDE